MWQSIAAESADHLKPQRLRELGIYGGAQGIWVDKARTGKLTLDGIGVSVGLLHTGKSYADDLSSDGLLYHYPSTERPAGRDVAEVNSTKAAGRLALPVFVITPGASSVERKVHLGWVEAWDDRARLFLITFSTSQPCVGPDTNDEGAFELTTETARRTADKEVRHGQQRFKFWVVNRYGPSCAACGIDVISVLDAAHLCPKEKNGSDDARNGIVLCAVHHGALDAGLLAIHPDTTQFHFRPSGPWAEDLRMKYSSLSHLDKKPHRHALEWRWGQWSSVKDHR
jgi:hypothetical protein